MIIHYSIIFNTVYSLQTFNDFLPVAGNPQRFSIVSVDTSSSEISRFLRHVVVNGVARHDVAEKSARVIPALVEKGLEFECAKVN